MAAWRAMEATTTSTTNANVMNVEHKLGLFSAWESERDRERESVTIKTKTNVELFCFALQVKTKRGGRGDKAEA